MIDKATIDLLRAAMRKFPELRIGALLAAVRKKNQPLTDFGSEAFAKTLLGELERYRNTRPRRRRKKSVVTDK